MLRVQRMLKSTRGVPNFGVFYYFIYLLFFFFTFCCTGEGGEPLLLYNGPRKPCPLRFFLVGDFWVNAAVAGVWLSVCVLICGCGVWFLQQRERERVLLYIPVYIYIYIYSRDQRGRTDTLVDPGLGPNPATAPHGPTYTYSPSWKRPPSGCCCTQV